MKFLADEGVDSPIVERLRQEGYDVEWIAETSPGIDDDTILRRANSENAVLITLDKDFGELVYRQNLIHAGVVLVRLAGLPPRAKAEIVATAIREYGAQLLNSFGVISPASIRIRRQRQE